MKHKIKFNYLKIENFLSVREQKFNFSSHNGLNYVFGINKDVDGTKNGSGKSTIFLSALLFALFGKTEKGINNKFIAHRQISPKKNVEVSLQFDINDDHYYIESGLNMPYSTSYFKLYKNEKDISKASIKETRKYFESEILRSSFDMFKNSIALSSNDTQQFFSMPKSVKREFIENIFKLNVFGIILKNIRTDINSLEKEILISQNTLKQLNESIDEFSKNEKSFTKDKKEKLNQIKEKILTKKSEKEKLIKNIKNIKNKIKEFSFENKDTCVEKREKIQEGISKIQSILRVSKTKITHNKEIINKYGHVLKEVCTDCHKKLEKKLNVNKAEKIVEEEINKIKKYERLLTQLYDQQTTIIEKITKIEENNQKIEKLNKQQEKDNGAIIHLKKDIKDLNDRLNEEKCKNSPFSEMINEYNSKKDENTKTLKNYYKRKKELDIIRHVVSEDGAKRFIITDLVDILNSRIRKYLDELGARFTCIFDGSFNCEFLTESGITSYENFSCGEKARIDISVLFAFRDILTSMGTLDSSILVLDEFIDSGLDDYAVNSLIKMLKRIVEETNQTIFLISHRSEINTGDFDNIIEIEKNNGFSSIIFDQSQEE